MAFDRFFGKDTSTHILKVEQRNPLIPKIRDQKYVVKQVKYALKMICID